MPQLGATPPLGQRRDRTVHLVLDDFGEVGSAYRKTDAAKADLTTAVADVLSGQYRHPLRVVAFNTAEGWARDVSADIARQVLACTRELDHELPAAVRAFVERRAGASPHDMSAAAQHQRQGFGPSTCPSWRCSLVRA
jgi:hypothetical protein